MRSYDKNAHVDRVIRFCVFTKIWWHSTQFRLWCNFAIHVLNDRCKIQPKKSSLFESMGDLESLTRLVNQLAENSLETHAKIAALTHNVDTLVSQLPGDPTRSEQACAVPQAVGPELQALARQIQQKYSSVTLDTSVKLHDDRVGNQREHQKTLNVISRCGRFAETCLKMLKEQAGEAVDKDGTAELFTIFAAQIAYLQDEYGCLFVSSLGDQSTARLFRQLRKNTSSLPADAVEDLRCAAQVAASLPQPTSSWRGGSRGWRGPYRGNSDFRGRRGYRGPGGFRGASQRGGYSQYPQHQQQQPDVYEQLVEGGT